MTERSIEYFVAPIHFCILNGILSIDEKLTWTFLFFYRSLTVASNENSIFSSAYQRRSMLLCYLAKNNRPIVFFFFKKKKSQTDKLNTH